ncbi:MAG: phosphatidate cytidylyltransferase [Kiritimatiellae bacterium]|nr:phosphatidate cytidylyltransferase [Kiritimatiellia bacterium]
MNPILKRIITALFVAAVVVTAIVYAPPAAISPVVAVLATLAIVEYGQLLKRKIAPKSAAYTFWVLVGAVAILALLSALPVIAAVYGNLIMLYVIAIIKISDMGGFAFGMSSAKLMKGGNHKLCPTISPNKSWEGLFGSVFASCVISSAFMPITHFGVGKSLILGVVAALVGTLGDLVESKFKRWVGVKDSSTMKFTNGMGGVLDMLDSLLIAPAVIAAIIKYL